MSPRPAAPRDRGLFGDHHSEPNPAAFYQANIDGGSRGNPGAAAYGVVIRNAKGEVIARLKKYIGRSTNNVAEYFGLIAALDYAENHGIRALHVLSDSELLVKQMRGQYKVRSEDLRPLFERAKKMSQSLGAFRVEHVYREQNSEADALANQALDETSGGGASSSPTTDKPAPQDVALRLCARCKGGQLLLDEPLRFPDGTVFDILLRIKK
ncbi:MAG TPA: ribonuclease HI family protein [Candidatus Acidoferrum sp.]|nr:ribonuclease HI family protein [Candidatus Acidoferrum sp.]